MKSIFLLLASLIGAGCASMSLHAHSNGSEYLEHSGQEISFVFAFHDKIPDAELTALLSDVNPDIVLVEVAPEDTLKRNFSSSPREMLRAFQWAEANQKKAVGFDCPMKTKPDDYSDETEREVSASFNAFDRKYNWRDGNNQKVAHELAIILRPFTDPVKMARRQSCMLHNIQSSLPAQGKALIITGAYHSDFFRAKFPGARYPVSKVQ